MTRPRSIIRVSCENRNCAKYHQPSENNIIKKGINSAGHRQYLCLHCGKYFVETKGTLFFHKRLGAKSVKQICAALAEKKGIRQISRDLNINRNTVCTIVKSIAEHPEVRDECLREMGFSHHDIEELCLFILKKRRSAKSSGDPKSEMLEIKDMRTDAAGEAPRQIIA